MLEFNVIRIHDNGGVVFMLCLLSVNVNPMLIDLFGRLSVHLTEIKILRTNHALISIYI